MGDAPAAKATREPTNPVELVVRADAHVDVADLEDGTATKVSPVRVSRTRAKQLLERHPYLTERKG